MTEHLHINPLKEGDCEVHAWPTEGFPRRLVEAMRSTHPKGINACRECVERAAAESKRERGQPQMQCPSCGAWEDDFDGFGMLAHTKPAYEDGCGYCSHPGSTDGICDICGKKDNDDGN